jgi:hypothetical protein
VSENRVLRNRPGPKRGEVIVRERGKTDEECDTHGRKDICYRGFLAKTEAKKPLGRPRYRCGNAKMDLK